MKAIVRITLILTILLASPTLIHAATYYVATTGSDSNSGTISSPWRTISKGISGVSAGDTLYIRGGTYSGTISIDKSGTASAPLIVAGYPGETPVVNGGGSMGEYSALFSLRGNYVHL